MNDNELERRLLEWAREYGGKDHGNGWPGRNFLATLIDHEGFVPNSRGYIPVPVRTAADEIEGLVMGMEAHGFFKPGRVLRCEYFMRRSPIEAKLQNMKGAGLPMSRAGFYLYLGQGRAFLSGALSLGKTPRSCYEGA